MPKSIMSSPAARAFALSAFRFKQFDTEIAAIPDTPPTARNSELVAVIYFGYGSTALNQGDREVLRDVVHRTALTTAMIFFIFVGATAFSTIS